MIIKSPFKDYYDHVATVYGGGDPRIVYVRNKIALSDVVEVSSFPLESPGLVGRWEDFDKTPETAYLTIAGRLYLVARKRYAGEVQDVNLFRLYEEPDDSTPKQWWSRKNKIVSGAEYPFIVELSRQIGAPVFVIHGVEKASGDKVNVGVYERIPNLGTVGLASLVSPTQMYQDISYFVGNLMKAVPDTKPPVELNNRQKIVKAGFDLVQSFRHRK